MNKKPTNVVDLTEHHRKREILALYAKHERGQVEPPESVDFSATGLSILDDVMYFLAQPDMHIQFEEEFLFHLKRFAINQLKQGKT